MVYQWSEHSWRRGYGTIYSTALDLQANRIRYQSTIRPRDLSVCLRARKGIKVRVSSAERRSVSVSSTKTRRARKAGKMKRMAVLAAVAAVCLALVAADHHTTKVADNDFLLKQKKIYNLLYYISQPSLNPSLYEEGQSYNIEANIDSYTNTVNDDAHNARNKKVIKLVFENIAV